MEHKFRGTGRGAQHGTDDQLEQYVLGQLSDSELQPLEEHLMICVACQDRLSATEDFAIGMREALADSEVTRPERVASGAPLSGWLAWIRRPAFAMAAGFAALILMAGMFLNSRAPLAPMAALQLTALRGEMPFAVPAREFDITLSDGPRDGGTFRVEVVNAMGQTMWTGMAESATDGVHLKLVKKLAPGDYFVRLYSTSGTVLHEYGFRIRP